MRLQLFCLGILGAVAIASAQAPSKQAKQPPDPRSLVLVGDRFKPHKYDEMTPEQKTMIDHMLAGPRGSADLPFVNVLLRSPEMGDLMQEFGGGVRFKTSVPQKLTELAIIITARYWTSQYEWQVHHRSALQAGVSPAIADAIAAGKRPQGMQPDEKAVYDFCTELLNTKQVGDSTFNAAKAAVGERGVVDLMGWLIWYETVCMVLNVDRYPLPEGAQAELKPLK